MALFTFYEVPYSVKLILNWFQIRFIDPERNVVNHQLPETDPNHPNLISGWNLLAQAVDRIMFVIYTIIIFVFLGAYIGGATTIIDNNTK